MELSKNHKYQTIYAWKKSGVICDYFNMLYEEYIKTTNCNHCGKEFKNSRDRQLDHDHETGLFRKIVCQSCNVCDSYIKYPDGVPSHSERQKKYYEENIEKMREREKKYREDNKDKISSRQKKYYIENKGKVITHTKKYYIDNKERITATRSEKNDCDCGGKFTKRNKSRHFKCKKHTDYLKSLE